MKTRVFPWIHLHEKSVFETYGLVQEWVCVPPLVVYHSVKLMVSTSQSHKALSLSFMNLQRTQTHYMNCIFLQHLARMISLAEALLVPICVMSLFIRELEVFYVWPHVQKISSSRAVLSSVMFCGCSAEIHSPLVYSVSVLCCCRSIVSQIHFAVLGAYSSTCRV